MSQLIALDTSLSTTASHYPESHSSCFHVITQKIQKVFWLCMALLDPVISFFGTQPLADALGLKTHTHGTNFKNYLNIRCIGADPSQGGQSNGSTGEDLGFREECLNHFFLFQDVSEVASKCFYAGRKHTEAIEVIHGTVTTTSRNGNATDYQYSDGTLIENGNKRPIQNYSRQIVNGFPFIWDTITLNANSANPCEYRGMRPTFIHRWGVRTLFPMYHAIASGTRLWTDDKQKGVIPTGLRILGGITGVFTPTVNIYIDDEDPLRQHLKWDPDYGVGAYKTQTSISVEYIGLSGIVHQGFNKGCWKRMQQSPLKTCIGMLRLLNPIGLSVLLVAGIWAIFSKMPVNTVSDPSRSS